MFNVILLYNTGGKITQKGSGCSFVSHTTNDMFYVYDSKNSPLISVVFVQLTEKWTIFKERCPDIIQT